MRFVREKIHVMGKDRIIMVGRRRKPGKRHPGGQLVQEKKPDRAQVAAAMPHRRWLPAKDKQKRPIAKDDRRAETVFGCLNLIGLVSDIEFDAGERFQDTVRRWKVVADSPREPQGFMSKITKSEHDPNESMPVVVRFNPMTDEEAKRRWADYNGAFCAVKTQQNGELPAPRHNLIVLNSVVIHNKTLERGDLSCLKEALSRLVDYYGLTATQKHALRK